MHQDYKTPPDQIDMGRADRKIRSAGMLGRVLFLRGYRRGAEGRALGMVLTMMPAIVGYPAVFMLMVLNWL